MAHPRRRSVYADRLLKFREFVFSDGAELTRCGAWREFFRDRLGDAFNGRVIFEIGCNDASFLATVAAKHASTAFVGIDWKCRALHTAGLLVTEASLQNAALLHGRAQDVRRIFAEGELDEVWLFHPDPCDTPRELPNRLFAEPFLTDLHQVLRDGGAVVLKTDHRDYYESAVALAGTMSDRFELAVTSADFWNDAGVMAHTSGRCFSGETTTFERRFRRKRQPIHFLELTKR
jgi:tRNA (guanine-N7-)-methyltransferase